MNPSIFRAYDIRGLYPQEIDEPAVYAISRAYIRFLRQKPQPQTLNPKSQTHELTIALGKDVRTSSPSLWRAAARGLTDEGVKVIDIGTISTDMLYFAVGKYGYDGGITISASHNPAEFNGMKIVREDAIPISSDSGLFAIRDIAKEIPSTKKQIAYKISRRPDENIGGRDPDIGRSSGQILNSEIEEKDVMAAYTEHNLSFIDRKKIKPFKVVINANFGMAGVAAKAIVKQGKLPVELVELNCQPDGSFPKGRPDPLIPDNRHETSALIKKTNADLGVAWDADADRCFFFNEKGEFVTPAFMTSLMAAHLLKKVGGPDALRGRGKEKIINDTRIFWPVKDTVETHGGELVLTKAGHTFIKERMRAEDGLFGAETSAHYYYRDNFYADNGMISFLLALEILSEKKQKLSAIIKEFQKKYAVSDEINFTVSDPEKVLASFKKKYAKADIDARDGLSINFKDWRFSLRSSNTEACIRLNVETRGDYQLLKQKVDDLSQEISSEN